MIDSKPFFSIVLPTKDRPDLINSFIKCTLNQTFHDFELIICDNSSNELTQKAISQFDDNRIVNLRTGNLKMSENWNKGIHAISGQYLVLMSDKGLLKQGALNYLNNLINNNNYDCITWSVDPFIDPDTLIQSKPKEHSRKVNSHDLIKIILGADWESFDIAPMHCTSCVSTKLISEIITRHKNLSQELNPDYTMAMQILLTTPFIFNLNQNLAVLRRPSLSDGYGNGSSFVKKTSLSKSFMSHHTDWVNRTNTYEAIPIKGNLFSLDHMLKDVYTVLNDHGKDPSFFLPKRERLISYYSFTYAEILWRTRVGVNMNEEYKLWLKSISQESYEIQSNVFNKQKNLRLTALKANIMYFIKTNIFTLPLLKLYRLIKYKNIGLKFLNLEDCFNSVAIKEYEKH